MLTKDTYIFFYLNICVCVLHGGIWTPTTSCGMLRIRKSKLAADRLAMPVYVYVCVCIFSGLLRFRNGKGESERICTSAVKSSGAWRAFIYTYNTLGYKFYFFLCARVIFNFFFFLFQTYDHK